MRIQFQILIFAVFFNIALFFIAATGFFPYTFYGDATTYDVDDPEYDINDPDKLPSADEMFNRLAYNTVEGKLASYAGVDLTYGVIIVGIVGLSLLIGAITKSSSAVSLLLVGSLFTLMWANSKRIIDSLVSGLDTSVNYLVVMFLLGMMISFVILLYDTASGQKSTK